MAFKKQSLKKRVSSILMFLNVIVIVCLFIPAGVSFANPVTLEVAQEAALNWMNEKTEVHFELNDISETLIADDDSEKIYYIFNFNPAGWVIISADDVAYPVIGYSKTGSYADGIRPPAFDEWMDNVKQTISAAQRKRMAPSPEVLEEWDRLINRSYTLNARASERVVGPLIQTGWDQNWPYNAYCPVDDNGPGGHALAGCTATALAQVLKYYNYPSIGSGSHTYTPRAHPEYGPQTASFETTLYDWANMPSAISSSNSEVARLIYHCAVSLSMNFGPDVSSSSIYRANNALKQYFKYDESSYIAHKSEYSNTDWENLLKAELDASRPVLYSGSGTGGHAFICDGYEGFNYFHFNWGWSGNYDGYFYLSDLTPGSHDYSNGQAGLFEVRPSDVPVLSVTPNFLQISESAGTCTFQISNSGAGTMAWSITENTDWLSVSPASGTGDQTVTVTYNASSVPSRFGGITITAPDATNGPRTFYLKQGSGSDTLVWETSKADAVAKAKSEGKKILLVAGRMTCSNTAYMRNTVCESFYPPIRPLIEEHFVPWYSDVDISSEHSSYAAGLSGMLPYICVIDPDHSEYRMDGTTSVQPVAEFHSRLTRIISAGEMLLSVTPFQQVVSPSAGTTTFNIANLLTDPMNWTVSENSHWLSVSPSSGTDGEAVTVTFDANTGLSRTASLIITADYGTMKSPATIGITQSSQSAFTTYRNRNRINAMAAEGDYIWLCTDAGVYKRDQNGTLIAGYTESDGLADNDVRSIAIDSDGSKWFATAGGGVSRFDGTNWSTYTTADGLASRYVHAIAIDGDGSKWFGTSGGVSKFDGALWTNYTTADGLASDSIRSIAIDRDGSKWFGTYKDGVSRFDGTSWRTYTTIEGLASDSVEAIAIDSDGSKWLGHYGEGVSRFDGTNWRTYTRSDGLASDYVNAVAIDSSGSKWFGTSYGVSRFDGTSWTTYRSADGLADNWVRSIAFDTKGNKWFGHYADGISKFDGTNWAAYAEPDKLPDNNVYAIAVDSDGSKWFGTSGEGVSRYDGTNWSTYTRSDGLASDYVYAIAIDSDGSKWFATYGGVSKFDGALWTSYTTADGLADNSVYAIAIDSDGSKWFGHYGEGVSRFDGTSWRTYTTADGLASDYVNAIAIDSDGSKWFGTSSSGISRFDGTSWRTYTTADGLASDYIDTIAIDSSGIKWFGTSYSGISRFDGTNWTTYRSTDGLAYNSVRSIAFDARGNKWFGTSDGLSRFNGMSWTTYRATDGLADNSTHSIAIDREGKVWIGTDGGVSVLTNDYPFVADPVADVNTDEDALDKTIDISNLFTVSDGTADSVTKSLLLNSNPSLVTASLSGNTLTLQYQENQFGTATMILRGTSNGRTVDHIFTVKVNPVDDPPIVAHPIADVNVIMNAPDTIIHLADVFAEIDNDNHIIIKTVPSNSNPNLVTATVSGDTLTLEYAKNQSGTAEITIRGTSNEKSVDDTFTVDVKNIGLEHVIFALQIMAGMTPTVGSDLGFDVKGDQKIGLEEAIYILQIVTNQ